MTATTETPETKPAAKAAPKAASKAKATTEAATSPEATAGPWAETHANGDITVTVKYGKGYEESWAVFRGPVPVVKQSILDYFEPEPETVEGLSLHELVINVTKLAHAVSAAANGLGGTVISGARAGAGGWTKAAAAPTEPAEPVKNPLFAKIDSLTSVPEVVDIYKRNEAAISADPELLAAWKAKGKSLKEAAK